MIMKKLMLLVLSFCISYSVFSQNYSRITNDKLFKESVNLTVQYINAVELTKLGQSSIKFDVNREMSKKEYSSLFKTPYDYSQKMIFNIMDNLRQLSKKYPEAKRIEKKEWARMIGEHIDLNGLSFTFNTVSPYSSFGLLCLNTLDGTPCDGPCARDVIVEYFFKGIVGSFALSWIPPAAILNFGYQTYDMIQESHACGCGD